MTSIQTPSPGEKLRGEFKTREPLEVFLHPGIAPVVMVSDLSGSSISDFGYPRNAMGRAAAAAVAAQNAQCQVVGTANRGKIYHIQGVVVFSATAGNMTFRVNDPAVDLAGATNVTAKQFMDRGTNDIPDLTVSQITSATLFGQLVANYRLEALISLFIPLNVVLRGFDFCNVLHGTVNADLDATWSWTEYLLSDR